MAELLSCPNEILCRIFGYLTTLNDLRSVMGCCGRFLKLIRECNKLWEHGIQVKRTLQRMSSVCYPVGELPINVMNKLVVDEYPISEFVEEILVEFIFHQKVNSNLTTKYYARKLLQFVRGRSLERRCEIWASSPQSQISLLEGAFFLSQFCQSEQKHLPSFSEVDEILEGITNQVKELVEEKKNVAGDMHNSSDEMIINCIHRVMFKECGFTVMDDGCVFDGLLDKVLQTKRGHLLILYVVFIEVARRLNFVLDIVIYFDESDATITSIIDKTFVRWQSLDGYTYFRLTNESVKFGNSRADPPEILSAGTFTRYITTILQNIELHSQWAVMEQSSHYFPFEENDLSRRCYLVSRISRFACCVFSQGDMRRELTKNYASLCSIARIQLEDAIQLLESNGLGNHPLRNSCLDELNKQRDLIAKREIRHRLPLMKYAVGLVMTYQFNNRTQLFCVIDSWKYDDARNRIFYHVLFDGSEWALINPFVCEADLALHTVGSVIDNPHVGFHFESFNGRRYIPNAETIAQYPEDEAVAVSLTEKIRVGIV